MGQAKILAFAGSARQGSFNKRLVGLAARLVENAGGAVTKVDLRDFAMPLFDGDYEAAHGQPETAKALKQLFLEHHGLLISSPEYNSSITPLLKNSIDWISRPVPGETPLIAFRGKIAGLVSASPGALGGLRGLVHLRSILGNIGVIVLPDQVAVSKANEAFQDDQSLKDAKLQELLISMTRELVRVTEKLGGA